MPFPENIPYFKCWNTPPHLQGLATPGVGPAWNSWQQSDFSDWHPRIGSQIGGSTGPGELTRRLCPGTLVAGTGALLDGVGGLGGLGGHVVGEPHFALWIGRIALKNFGGLRWPKSCLSRHFWLLVPRTATEPPDSVVFSYPDSEAT